jgi:hypothetical protein
LGVDAVEFGGGDERIDGGGALAIAVGARDEPGLPAEDHAASGALGGVVGEADAAVKGWR